MFGSKPGTTLLQVAAGLEQDSERQSPQIKLALPSLPERARLPARGRPASAAGAASASDWELPSRPEVSHRVL